MQLSPTSRSQPIQPCLISERFVRYYQNLGFKQLPGTSLLHPSIPMTFVMSAGLAQVETAIDQLGSRSPVDDYVLVQNCFRHFDVDRIGKNSFHLSLFEMPGAFSFGHIDRQVTVERMWRFLVGGLRIDPSHLWATYFAGGEISGNRFEKDIEAYQAWRAVGLPDERIVALGVGHNFWKQGGGIDGQEASRKCGPNTELFFDRGPHHGCGPACRPGCGCGCDRFVEFANSLFIFAEIDAETNGLSWMEEPFTESVIGTERVAAILAGKPTVFEIETLKPLLEKLRSFYPGQPAVPSGVQASERILVDHVRALVFLAADGAPAPGKGGRRRLMRILIRRALAQLRILQVESLRCLSALIDLVIALAGDQASHLEQGRDTLLEYVETEAQAFEQTLARGYRQLDRLLARSNGRALGGRELVSLVKQFGIPVPLLKATLAHKGCEFREGEYSRTIEQWRHQTLVPDSASH